MLASHDALKRRMIRGAGVRYGILAVNIETVRLRSSRMIDVQRRCDQSMSASARDAGAPIIRLRVLEEIPSIVSGN